MLPRIPTLAVLAVIALWGCGRHDDSPKKIATFPLDSLDGLLENSLDKLSIDLETSHDGVGSLYFFTDKPQNRLLFDVPLKKVRSNQFVWRARVKTQSFARNLFFEFVVHKTDGTTRFKRVPCSNVKRFSDWVLVDAVLDLEPGEVPDNLRLVVYTDGPGHVWIDEMEIWDGLPPDHVEPKKASGA